MREKMFGKKKKLFEIRVGHHMGQLRAEALAFFTSFWEQRGPLECRDICESLRGFYSVLATTWASWSGDTCESLSGFYLVLGTTWASWSRDTCESLSGIYLVLGTSCRVGRKVLGAARRQGQVMGDISQLWRFDKGPESPK